MGIFKDILKQIEKELKIKPKRKNNNLYKVKIQNIRYFRKKPNFKYIRYTRIKFNNPYLDNITF